jgi:Ca2+-binding RTX toxin-like protein
LGGESGDDTYFGDRGNDNLNEGAAGSLSTGGNDTMYGGNNTDQMIGGEGNDLLVGMAGDENLGNPEAVAMHGGLGNDVLRGGPGDDAMNGNEGTDQHRGNMDNDFIDAASEETTATDAPDVVDCGDGVDTAVVRPNDIVLRNCENVDEV